MQVCQLLNHVLTSYHPHTYTSIVINHNTTSTPHKDTKNTGPSTITTLGDFTDGGNFLIWHDNNLENPPTEVEIRGKLHVFTGSQFLHANSSYSGERFSIIWFTYKAALTRQYTPDDIEKLMTLGFNLPQDPLPLKSNLNLTSLSSLRFLFFFICLCRDPQDIVVQSASFFDWDALDVDMARNRARQLLEDLVVNERPGIWASALAP